MTHLFQTAPIHTQSRKTGGYTEVSLSTPPLTMGLIRFVLAISVIVFHSGKSLWGIEFMGGSMAVQCFYIISGFYMTLILNEKYGSKINDYYLFLTNRFLRLYPLYIAVTIATAMFYAVDFCVTNHTNSWIDNLALYEKFMDKDTVLYLVVSHVLIVGQDLSLFLGFNVDTGALFFTKNFHTTTPQVNGFFLLGQTWTIGLELMFYTIAPFVVGKKLSTVGCLIIASITIRLVIYAGFNLKTDPWTYRFFPAELAYFLLGCICYHLYVHFNKRFSSHKAGLLMLLVFLVSLTMFYRNIFNLLAGNHLYQTAFHLVYVVLFFLSIPFLFILTKKSKFDTLIGEYSYPLYLCHSLTLYIDQRFNINNICFVILSALFMSFLLNVLLSNRIETYRKWRVRASQKKKVMQMS